MNKEELLEYIDNNSSAVANFKDKVRADQQAKNVNRLNGGMTHELNGKLINLPSNLLVIFMTSSLGPLKPIIIHLRKNGLSSSKKMSY